MGVAEPPSDLVPLARFAGLDVEGGRPIVRLLLDAIDSGAIAAWRDDEGEIVISEAAARQWATSSTGP